MTMTATKLAVPTIHINGSSREFLINDMLQATDAIRAAIDAVRKAAPNARDYYPQGTGAFDRAMTEHRARLAKLESVWSEIGEIIEATAE